MSIFCSGYGWHKGAVSPWESFDGSFCVIVRRLMLRGKLDLDLKKRIIKNTMWSTVLICAAETWTLSLADRKRPLNCRFGKVWNELAAFFCMFSGFLKHIL